MRTIQSWRYGRRFVRFVPSFTTKVVQTAAQVCEGFGAVADLVFFGLTQFREGFLMAFGNKQRIVAEAALSAGRKADPPFACAFKQSGLQFKFIRGAGW